MLGELANRCWQGSNTVSLPDLRTEEYVVRFRSTAGRQTGADVGVSQSY